MVKRGLISPQNKESVRDYLMMSYCIGHDKNSDIYREAPTEKKRHLKQLERDLEEEEDFDKCIQILSEITNLEYQIYGNEA